MSSFVDPTIVDPIPPGLARRIRGRRPAPARPPHALRLHQDLQAVLDDAPYRSFDTMEQDRQWCEANLPEWLGDGRTQTHLRGLRR